MVCSEMSLPLTDMLHSHWSSEKHHCILERTLSSSKTEKTPFYHSGASKKMHVFERQTALTNKLSSLFSVP